MKIYKFGGASIKDANGVRNIVQILTREKKTKILIIVSAMGKMTNALENVVNNYFFNKQEISKSIQVVEDFHFKIIDDLFQDSKHVIYSRIRGLFQELIMFLERNKSPKHSFVYDQIVSYGELISTSIISEYLNHIGIENIWLDARNLIKTDSNFREGSILWEETQKNINQLVPQSLLGVTQGFLGSDANFFTTTLGREGSDYSAAIFAYCLDAESVTIWKDVPGVLNADPRYFAETQLLEKIPYQEAIEMAFYGASVIHPKTLQPLKAKEIPLYVRSFLEPTITGSAVCNVSELVPLIPCSILKQNQHLISVASLDFSFIEEENISTIFGLLSKYQAKVSIIQNSAISFRFCIDDKYRNLPNLLKDLKDKFRVECIENVNLFTIRHADEKSAQQVQENKQILLKQVFQNTIQIVTK